MEQDPSSTLRLSDLIHRRRPLTFASSLLPSSPNATTKHIIPNSNQIHKPPSPNPEIETLKLFNSTKPLIGTLALPSFPVNNLNINCSCFQFSDDCTTVCCYVMYFNPRMVGRKIRVLACNFIPSKCGRIGYLEIMRWDFVQTCGVGSCSLSFFSSFCWNLGGCDVKDNAKLLVFGVVESVSSIFVVPCASMESGSNNVSGFLVNVLICECSVCKSKFLIPELKKMSEGNVKEHSFSKMVIVYFCGLTSSWHPGISRLIGDVVLLSGLKKKSVFISKEESKTMHVTADGISVHIVMLFKNQSLTCRGGLNKKSECGSYSGIITGIYMQGMVVELDQDVMLLLTDQHLNIPHCLRVGAIVTLRNVHFVNPKFSWGKMLILGACCKSSIHMESFSPLESGCHLKLFSLSLLQKFIGSLSFPARLWVLLGVSCFRRKFSGILSEKEILGSKHKEGLVQKYTSSYLPQSAFRFRHGVLLEFCKHNFCSGDNEVEYSGLKLVTPIANLIDYVEASWKKILNDRDNCAGIDMKKNLFCGGRFYPQPIRRVIRTEEIGVVVLGTLKISLSSGRLQLVDATGSVDVMFDLPVSWDFDRIFEDKNFTMVMEAVPYKLVGLSLNIHKPLSCRRIFTNAPLVERQKTSLHLYHDSRVEDARNHSLFFDWTRSSKELENGKYHLLFFTHKFPIRRKYNGGQSNTFAEAIILPWNLLVTRNPKTATVAENHFPDSTSYLTNKRLKIDQLPSQLSVSCLTYAQNELSGHFVRSCSSSSNSCRGNTCYSDDSSGVPCSIAIKGLQSYSQGILNCSNENVNNISTSSRSKVILEFGPISFRIYKALKIGCCYLFEHQVEDKLCSLKSHCQFRATKVFINSQIRIRSLDFSSHESLQHFDISDCVLDVRLFLPDSVLDSLVSLINFTGSSLFETEGSSNQETGARDLGVDMITVSTQSSAISYSDNPLPVGGLVSLHGLIVGLHACDFNDIPVRSMLLPGKDSLPLFLQGNGGVCVHLLVSDITVTISYDLSKQAYPVGFGKDVHATFHRILVLSGKNKYMMTPASFVTIHKTNLICDHNYELNCKPRLEDIQSVNSPNIVTPVLICDLLQSLHLKPVQLRCRVVALYALVMEATTVAKVDQPSGPFISIPLAGFVMGDGSSYCCCWTESENAMSLFGLYSEDNVSTKASRKFQKNNYGARLPHISNVGRLNCILKKHGRVVVKNYGSLIDSFGQEFAFSFGSGDLIRRSEEDILTRLVINSSMCRFWNVIGSLMDRETLGRLQERLSKLEIDMQTSLPNVWATNISPTNTLAEARNIIHQLL